MTRGFVGDGETLDVSPRWFFVSVVGCDEFPGVTSEHGETLYVPLRRLSFLATGVSREEFGDGERLYVSCRHLFVSGS